MSDAEYTIREAAIKDPAESKQVRLVLYDDCVRLRLPNEQYGPGEFVRPTKPNGFSYEATTGGTTAIQEPNYPRTVGQTTTDGSVIWTCRAAGTNAINPITAPSAVSDPAPGITIANVGVDEDYKILATYEGGVLGQDYDAVFSFTLNGVTRVKRHKVQVRKR